MKPRTRWLVAQAAVTVVLLVLLFRNFDRGAFQDAFRQTPIWFYAASLVALAAGHLLYAFKWLLILRAMGRAIPFRLVAEQYAIALFFNNFLPTAVGGDVARVYYLGRREGYASIGISVLVDRALGFLGITLWATILMWSLTLSTPAWMLARQVLTILFAGFLMSFVVVGCFSLAPVSRWLAATRLLAPAARILDTVRDGIQPIRGRPGTLAVTLVIVLAYSGIVTWVYRTYFALAADRDVSFPASLAVVLGIAILSNIPISVNGIGLREQLHYLLFGALGVSKELAVSASILVFSELLLLSLVGCVVWLRVRTLDAPPRIAPAR